jgi:hypothetical protein
MENVTWNSHEPAMLLFLLVVVVAEIARRLAGTNRLELWKTLLKRDRGVEDNDKEA